MDCENCGQPIPERELETESWTLTVSHEPGDWNWSKETVMIRMIESVPGVEEVTLKRNN